MGHLVEASPNVCWEFKEASIEKGAYEETRYCVMSRYNHTGYINNWSIPDLILRFGEFKPES